MAISLGDVSTQSVKKTKKKAKKKMASKVASEAASKPAKSAKRKTKKSISKKTRPWQTPELSAESSNAAQDLPKAPAEALKSAADALSASALDFGEQNEGMNGFEFADSGPRTSEERRQRRKDLQDELVKEWLAVAEELKQRGIEQLPSSLADKVKSSWFGQVQFSPTVKVPIPDFLLTKINR
jgi:hypothetical protein